MAVAPQWGVANGHHAEGPRKIHGARVNCSVGTRHMARYTCSAACICPFDVYLRGGAGEPPQTRRARGGDAPR